MFALSKLFFYVFCHPFSHHPTSSMTTVSAIIGPWTTLIRVIVHGIDLTQKMIGGSMGDVIDMWGTDSDRHGLFMIIQ